MKSTRRHELKENVLAQELGRLKVFFSRHGGWIIGLAAAVAFVVLIVYNLRARDQRALASERARHARLINRVDISTEDRLAAFAQLAENAKDPLIAADSAIRAANICSQQYLDLLKGPSTAPAPESRRNAERFYRLVIDQHPDKKLIVANAYYGLGVLAENSGDKEAALANYAKAFEIGGPDHAVAAELELRTSSLQEWFKQEKFPQTMPADSQPATAPASPAGTPAASP